MVRFTSSWSLRTALIAVAALALRGPARVDAQRTTFTSGVDMVPLTVTVTDKAGKYITGLTGDHFAVFEDGVQQSLSFFASDEVPVDMALVLDTSGSMRSDLPIIQSAANELVKRLRANDRGAVVEVNNTAGIPQPFTSDHEKIVTALSKLATAGSTALYDGLYIVLKEFERERRATHEVRRQALVLLSDGLDNTSHLSFEDVIDLARRANVNIYVIALRGEAALIPRDMRDGTLLTADYSMGAVARETGGRTFFPKVARELPAICGAIAEELASQYELGYVPARLGGDGTFRHVTVQVQPETGRARTRTGYYASRTTRGQ